MYMAHEGYFSGYTKYIPTVNKVFVKCSYKNSISSDIFRRAVYD